MFTALLLSSKKTLEIGQLIHASFPEVENLIDGLFQIDDITTHYRIESGVNIFFRARHLWECKISDMLANSEIANILILENDEKKDEEYKFEIQGTDNKEHTLETGVSITDFSLHKTMFLQ